MKFRWIKRSFSVVLSMCLLCAMLPLHVAAVEVDYVLYPTAGGYLRVNQHNGTLVDCANLSGDLVIPETIEGVQVTAIADRAFYGCDELTSVTVPGTVSTIGDQVFTSCLALKSVVFGEGVTTLGKSAFRYCYSLSTVSLPSTLTAIDDYTFYRCLALKNITVPAGVTKLGSNSFADCENLAAVSLPASVQFIGEYAFSGCAKLQSINLPSGISVLNTAVFNGCSSLTQLIVPDGVQRLAGLSLRNCTALQKLSLPNSINSIGGNALDGCKDVTFYVNAGSYAQAFASANGIPFVLGTLSSGSNGSSGGNSSSGNTDSEDEIYPETSFTDVQSHWAKEYIEWAVYRGYFSGESETKFSPNVTMNRAMLVTVLYNIENRPAATTSNFTDVPTGKYYTQAVAWAAANGIVSGYEDNTFRPKKEITRQELATMLYNYATYKKMDTTTRGDVTQFKDYDKIMNYAGTAMSWAVGMGIIGGMGDATLAPRGEATRAQGTVMLKKLLEP